MWAIARRRGLLCYSTVVTPKTTWSKEPLPPSRDDWWGKEAGSKETTLAALGVTVDLDALRAEKIADLVKLSEWQQNEALRERLVAGTCVAPANPKGLTFKSVGLSRDNALLCVQAGMASSLLHLESRVASALGHGFYTIGPAGEEPMAAVGMALREDDAIALHYRHLATQIARQLKSGRPMDDILMDRARGHVVSRLDPVCGGRHCALGGSEYDFLVTSTLASQAPPAVGRALGSSLAHHIGCPSKFKKDFVSYVSVGDGSINHAHYLAAVNMAEYAGHRGYKVPVVFGISDNGISISLRGYDWLCSEFVHKLRMPVHFADGTNILDVMHETQQAVSYARKHKKPVTIVYRDVPRRFGHAATDRQAAYLSEEEISKAASRDPLAGICAQLVEEGVATYGELLHMYDDLWARTRAAFARAVLEPKITTREELVSTNSAPLVPVPSVPTKDKAGRPQLMRKHMTQVIDETLATHKQAVYLGEDVVHGGYYLVTDGLADKYPTRVRDFPPEETVLVGSGIGYAQAGLLPIVEIPYAKYLDCAADMFYEAGILHWLTNGRQPNGMIIRLQGFDRGVFGGNFHTHNTLHIPPGIDVVCYSNGPDYARGWRYAVQQALAGRVVMSVDSTNLLNLRHVTGRDNAWQFPLTGDGEVMSWDEVRTYGTGRRVGIVTYGNGVVTALQAKEVLEGELNVRDVTVVDSPYLSDVPGGLRSIVSEFDTVVFADVCKQGQQPLASHITQLQSEGLLPTRWRCVAAARTYNPLGTTLTFTSRDDIIGAVLDAIA